MVDDTRIVSFLILLTDVSDPLRESFPDTSPLIKLATWLGRGGGSWGRVSESDEDALLEIAYILRGTMSWSSHCVICRLGAKAVGKGRRRKNSWSASLI